MQNEIYYNKLKVGDEKAFRKLLEENSGIVFSLLSRMVFDKTLHEDLAQDIFMKVAQNIKSFRGDSKISTWIYTIAYRHIMDFLKKRRNDIVSDASPIDDIEPYAGSDPREEINSPDIEEALMNLEEKYRICVAMKYIDNRSLKEIASITNLSVGAVKSRIHRGIKKLRNYLT